MQLSVGQLFVHNAPVKETNKLTVWFTTHVGLHVGLCFNTSKIMIFDIHLCDTNI